MLDFSCQVYFHRIFILLEMVDFSSHKGYLIISMGIYIIIIRNQQSNKLHILYNDTLYKYWWIEFVFLSYNIHNIFLIILTSQIYEDLIDINISNVNTFPQVIMVIYGVTFLRTGDNEHFWIIFYCQGIFFCVYSFRKS